MSTADNAENRSETDLPRTPRVEHGPSYIPPYDRLGETLPSADEVKSWYSRNERKIKVAAVVGVAYLLNKRAIKKVVTTVVKSELEKFAQDSVDFALSPEWQQTVLKSYVDNGWLKRI